MAEREAEPPVTDPISAWLAGNWAQQPAQFHVPVEGAQIACRGWNLESADRPGLILVHGFRAHARWWDHIAPALDGFRVVALDLSGMGDSDHRAQYSREQNGREVLAVAKHCGFDPVTIVAHSFGAMGSMIAARQAPGKVRRLIVIDSALPTEEDGSHQIPTPPPRFYESRDEAVARFRLLPPGEWPQPAVLDYIAAHSVTESPNGWTWKFDPEAAASLNREAYRDAMMGVTVPVDLIYGDRTEIMTPERRESLRELAGNLRREVVIPFCHHHIVIERPLALAVALNALLAGT